MLSVERLREQLARGHAALLEQTALRPLLEALERLGGWLVGGIVRDLCLGRPAGDLDFVVPGAALQMARSLRRRHGGTIVPLDEQRGIVRLVLGPHLYVDLADMRGGSLTQDLAERDFTINAMALAPAGGQPLVDPHGGLADLASGVLRAVSDGSFRDDPLRILRAARFGARLDLRLEPATEASLREAAPALADVAMERVHAELQSLLGAPSALPWLEKLREVGAFQPLLASGGVPVQPWQPSGTGRPLAVLAAVWPAAHDGASSAGPLRHPEALLWAALLADLAGADLDGEQVTRLLAHLRLASRTRRSAAAIYSGPRQIAASVADPAALVQALLRLGPEVREALLLGAALHPEASLPAHEAHRTCVAPFEDRPPLLGGHDLLRAGLKPGPSIGRLLEQVEVRRRLGQLGSRKEALAWALAQDRPRNCDSPALP